MNIEKFSIPEMFSNSKGKTACALVCAFIIVVTGCIMGIRGAFSDQADSMLQGLAFVTVGAGLLGLRRFTPDKEIDPTVDPTKKNEKLA